VSTLALLLTDAAIHSGKLLDMLVKLMVMRIFACLRKGALGFSRAIQRSVCYKCAGGALTTRALSGASGRGEFWGRKGGERMGWKDMGRGNERKREG